MTAIDWFRIIVGLERAGMTEVEQARRIGVPRTTLRGWKEGSEPHYASGQALLELYEQKVEPPNDGKPYGK